jgi:DNA-binding PadR family transcriptional regulator
VVGGFQQVVLIGIAAFDGNADAAAIRTEVERRLGRSVASGAVHITLQRLEQMELIVSEALPYGRRSDGRGPRQYRITSLGVRKLEDAKSEVDRIWEGV